MGRPDVDASGRRGVASPPARSSHAMAYDSARGRVVLFGGIGGLARNCGDTWEWDGDGVGASGLAGARPRARGDHAMAYDSARGRVVLFGRLRRRQPAAGHLGVGRASRPGRDRTPAAAPAPRAHGARAWPTTARAAGSSCSAATATAATCSDTWEWDGTSVDVRPTASGGPSSARDVSRAGLRQRPRPRRAFGGYGGHRGSSPAGHLGVGRASVDWSETPARAGRPRATATRWPTTARAQRVVLFGGVDGSTSSHSQDTWEWDGATWIERTPASAAPPSARMHAMAYDSARRRVVLFGGYASAALGDTWEWDGSAWAERRPRPAVAARTHAMAYDSARGAWCCSAASMRRPGAGLGTPGNGTGSPGDGRRRGQHLGARTPRHGLRRRARAGRAVRRVPSLS